jgi:hypothetical protein
VHEGQKQLTREREREKRREGLASSVNMLSTYLLSIAAPFASSSSSKRRERKLYPRHHQRHRLFSFSCLFARPTVTILLQLNTKKAFTPSSIYVAQRETVDTTTPSSTPQLNASSTTGSLSLSLSLSLSVSDVGKL